MNRKITVIIDGWSSCEKIRHKPYWVKHGDVMIAELDEAAEK